MGQWNQKRMQQKAEEAMKPLREHEARAQAEVRKLEAEQRRQSSIDAYTRSAQTLVGGVCIAGMLFSLGVVVGFAVARWFPWLGPWAAVRRVPDAELAETSPLQRERRIDVVPPPL